MKTSEPEPLPASVCSLTLAIDFDHTWTADPHGWRAWHDFMVARGHIVILTTSRSGWSDDMGRAHLPAAMPIVYCGHEFKEHATRKAGWLVNIWIDDMPGMIQDCCIFGGNISPANIQTQTQEERHQ
jgi:hypothetical protein